MKIMHIIGGGTVYHIRPHLALCAPAYGTAARELQRLYELRTGGRRLEVKLHLTRMAGGPTLETNADIAKLVEEIKANPDSKIVFFSAAMCDFKACVAGQSLPEDLGCKTGKELPRLESNQRVALALHTADKVIENVRKGRKDIFLIGFKTTRAATPKEMFQKGLRLLKLSSCNLVLVNDIELRTNMIVTPEESTYHVTTNRQEALENLLDMAILRSHLTFTQSTVIEGQRVEWGDPRIPQSLREVIAHCIRSNAYKEFHGATVGHFAIKVSDTEFITSIRRSNFNHIGDQGLVYVKTDGPDTVLAYGAKPSVGGQSQRIVFHDHPGMDCIVHFHCPLKDNPRDKVPVRSQREYECGSHECGRNTSNGLAKFGNLKAVYLDQHGPNIVFNRSIDPKEVIQFIDANFDLDKKTVGSI